MINLLKLVFRKINKINKCPKCKNKTHKITNKQYLPKSYHSVVVDYDVFCNNCGEVINHYSCGKLQHPTTKTEYIKTIWNEIEPITLTEWKVFLNRMCKLMFL